MCGWKDGWVDHGGGWQGIMGAPGGRRVVGDGLVDHRGSRISLMSSLQGELTHPHHCSFVFAKRERALAKYFWTLCATLLVWEENIYCPSPVPI